MPTNKLTENFIESISKSVVLKDDELISNQLKNLFLFTVNHKTAPVAIRERFAISEYTLKEAILNLKAYKSIKAFVILSTCNRTEVYFIANDLEKALSDIFDFLSKYLNLEQKIAKEYSTLLKSQEAINHLFKVAAGLNSLVIGESQVLSQLKYSYSLAQKEKTLDKSLELIFQCAIKSAKEVHKETSLSKDCQSISSAAIDLVNMISGPVKTKSIMVLGAGKMAELALEHTQKIGGSKETVVLNRSPHRVIEFSDKYKIDKSIPFENVYEAMVEVDIIIAATGAPHFIIFADQFKAIRKEEKPLLILDISMPRNVDSEFSKLPNVKLMDIDSLQLIYNQTGKTNTENLKQAEQIISENTNNLYEKLSKEALSDFIKELKSKVESIRTSKLSTLKGNKDTFTNEELEYITKNIVNTILHTPLKVLNNSSILGTQKEKLELLKDLFEI